ncbi:MAG TPA: ABC transporter ATP-binding protein [Bacteroidales bacterium]|nr:ABC transporter ATP-binding protein [Bacteroidales bacterium]HOK97813.1 ABC transporter ATP-binding protein [Bacteroidales bacterium]HPO64571.1 ABC transporter ATP-binding protein [Bacteroidales bacterium]
MQLLELKEVSKFYGSYCALNRVSFSVPRGSIFGLLGPNGAGKTTTLRIINQILAPDEGQVLFENRPLRSDDVERMGYLPEERGLYKKMRVGEQALYLAQLKGLDRKEALKRLKYWFEKLEITGWWDKKVEQLSKGMAQKVQFVTTVVHDPALLIFDEPFSGFDPINASMLKNEILELKNRGATIIFSTHNMNSVEELCDAIALINRSQVILAGEVEAIKQQHKKNIFEVIFTGSVEAFQRALRTATFEILSIRTDRTQHQAVVKILSAPADNELLKSIIESVHVVSYREILPTMDEIFIDVVTGK